MGILAFKYEIRTMDDDRTNELVIAMMHVNGHDMT